MAICWERAVCTVLLTGSYNRSTSYNAKIFGTFIFTIPLAYRAIVKYLIKKLLFQVRPLVVSLDNFMKVR